MAPLQTCWKALLSLKRTQRIWRSDFFDKLAMNARQALARLVSLRVPGAIEAVDKLPSDANAVLTWLIAAPVIAAHHTGCPRS
jgi:hypothetical protein